MSVAVAGEPGIVLRPLRRVEYERLVEDGLLGDDEPVELLEGAIVEMMTEGPRHRWLIDGLQDHLSWNLSRSLRVTTGHPFAAGDLSEPEPDLAVIRRGSYGPDRHPDTALLLIEVAHSSLPKDLGIKVRVYAAAGVPEYWVVDLVHDIVHVFSDPSARGYARHVEHTFDEALDAVGVAVVIRDLLASEAATD